MFKIQSIELSRNGITKIPGTILDILVVSELHKSVKLLAFYLDNKDPMKVFPFRTEEFGPLEDGGYHFKSLKFGSEVLHFFIL
jgi:hypothetical protein